MIDYDICTNTLYSIDAFNKLMEPIGATKKFEPQKVWLTTSEVWNGLSTEFTIKDNNIMVVPQYILPVGEHTVVLSDNLHTPNRSERRKKQKEERKRKCK